MLSSLSLFSLSPCLHWVPPSIVRRVYSLLRTARLNPPPPVPPPFCFPSSQLYPTSTQQHAPAMSLSFASLFASLSVYPSTPLVYTPPRLAPHSFVLCDYSLKCEPRTVYFCVRTFSPP
ncbi:hypothetical protein OF83DRAFT_97676 [Amylostereum chailletii]|nr:hypothetical protein OF83DRAFT_97676 [Amylostereum chailletii]